jgi:Ribonuclease G/E
VSAAKRQRLRQMLTELLPPDAGGVIVRTVSEDATREVFERELNSLIAATGSASSARTSSCERRR